jgi:hypothetical protein
MWWRDGVMSKKGTPINSADVLKRAAEILSGPRESDKTAKDAMRGVRVSKEDPLVKQILSSR